MSFGISGLFIPFNLDLADESGLTAMAFGAIGAGAVLGWVMVITLLLKLITWLLKQNSDSNMPAMTSDLDLQPEYWTYGYIIPAPGDQLNHAGKR